MKAPSTKMKFSKTDKKLKHSHILRPRTAYNYFYKHQRSLILKEKSKTSTSKSNKTCVTDLEDSFDNELFTKRPHRKTHGLISLQQLTKTVAKRWKEASPETREKFRSLAERDKVRYTNAVMAESGLQKNSRYTNTDLINPPIECFSGDFQINLMVKSEFKSTRSNYHILVMVRLRNICLGVTC